MRSFTLLFSAVALALASSGCNKPTASESTTDEPRVVSAPSTAVTPAPVATPAPNPKTPAVVETPPAAPATPEFAPPGVFYLVALVRVETANGVVGLKPGTGVKLVRPGVYLSSYGEVTLSDAQVTNNMTLARQVAGQDAAQQAQLKKAQEDKARALAAAQAARETIPAATPAPVPEAPLAAQQQRPLGSGTMLNSGGNGAKGLGATHSSTKDKVYTDSYGRKYWRDIQGRARYDF